MKVIYGLENIPKFRKPVVALGVFDGVHRGHRYILENAVRQARRIGRKSVVLTFWPHPQAKESIYSLQHRLRLIGEIGIDVCIVINFNKRFSQMKAGDFVRKILFAKLGAGLIYVGRNFRFGKGAEGNLSMLRELSGVYNFKLKPFAVLKINNQPVSSTYIRRLIAKGDLEAAEKLLLRPVTILGTVIRGSSLGRKLGFPTANIDPHHEVLPPSGIYAVYAILDNRRLCGACYIGSKPTFNKSHKSQVTSQIKKHIEAYILGLSKYIYGKYLEIQFVRKIREDRKFPSGASLAAQIRKDVEIAKALLLSSR